jgi:hypothetical protein
VSTTAAAWAALAVPVLGLAGCGGNSADSPAGSPADSQAALPSPPPSPPAPAATDGYTTETDVYKEKVKDFCGVHGLTVQLVSTTEEMVKLTVHKDGMPYSMWHHTFTDVYTNAETKKSATELTSDNEKIVNFTDNGDGTATVTEFKVYNSKTYDDDGHRIGQRDGHFTLTKAVYHQGTVSDPNDDVPVHEHDHFVDAVENGKAVAEIGEDAPSGRFCTVMVREIG